MAQEVTLGEEVRFVELYLGMMQARYQRGFSTHFAVEDEAREGLVPAFILQPLVENALQHGAASRPAGGRVEVAARRVNGRLRLEVRDKRAPVRARADR